MTDGNKTHGYYIVKWDRPQYEFQEDTKIFQSGDLVYNATYLNLTQQENHWYNQSTIKNVVHVQHVLADNFALIFLSIKIPNTCNHRETVQKGATKVPYFLHKGLLDEIIHRYALDFIEHDKDGHKYEEEDSNYDKSMLSSD